MRILIHDRSGHPFAVQLSRELARRGYDILHSYGSFFQTPKGDLTKSTADPDTLAIEGIELDKPFAKYSMMKRHFQEMEYARRFVAQAKAFDPDVLVLAQMPPDAQAHVHQAFRHSKTKIVFWVQDIYGLAIRRILRQKISIVGDLVGRFYIRTERSLLREGDAVVLITDDFMPLMEAWNIESDKLYVVRNWAPLENMPVHVKDNGWAQSHQLADKQCIMYSGTLGMKHNPNLLLQLALHFRVQDRVRVVVISEGLGADWLRQQRESLQLENLILLDYQPFAALPDVLGTADLLVAILEPDAGIYSAPSKVLTYFCAQRPLLLAVPPENLSARIVSENDAGIVVGPDDVRGFVDAADRLLGDDALRESLAVNARTYAETHFDINVIGDRFEEIILRHCSADGAK